MQKGLVIRKCETIEVPVGQNVSITSFPFPQNNENIEKGYVFGVDTFYNSIVSASPSAYPLVDQTILQKAYLILAVDNAEDIYKIPLTTLVSKENAGIIRELDGVKINFTKSRVVIADNTGLVAGTTFLFNFFYRDDNKI
jgi:hypothetical protein